MITKTITFHNAHNYGAVLQAYALQQYLGKLNINNEIIDFARDKNTIFKKIELKNIKNFIACLYLNLGILIKYKKLRELHGKFDKFIDNDLKKTQKYSNYKNLVDNPPLADFYIAGSDQVWNVYNGARPEFFLDFGNKKIKKISYAASIGIYDVKEEYRKQMKKYLNRFDYISVRESESKDYIQRLTNRECEVNIDPVFLLSKEAWSDLAIEPQIEGKYILCYPLLYSPLINKCLKKIKEKTGYKVVVLTTEARVNVEGDININNAGPKEFLGLIKNAEYVLTSSFHGTAFSIIFNKNFFSILTGLSPFRIINILKIFGMNGRCINSVDDVVIADIPYNEINKKISEERERSKRYLLKVLGRNNE